MRNRKKQKIASKMQENSLDVNVIDDEKQHFMQDVYKDFLNEKEIILNARDALNIFTNIEVMIANITNTIAEHAGNAQHIAIFQEYIVILRNIQDKLWSSPRVRLSLEEERLLNLLLNLQIEQFSEHIERCNKSIRFRVQKFITRRKNKRFKCLFFVKILAKFSIWYKVGAKLFAKYKLKKLLHIVKKISIS